MKKSHIALFLVIATLLCLLTACGQSSNRHIIVPSLQLTNDDAAGDSNISSDTTIYTQKPTQSPTTTVPPQPTQPSQVVNPSSTYLPDVEAFLYYSASSTKSYGNNAYQKQWSGSHPMAAFETVCMELMNLFAQDRYQLYLQGGVVNPHYDIPVYDYYYTYTGTAKDVPLLTDKYGEYTFHVSLSFFLNTNGDYFQIIMRYGNCFDLEDPGTRTTRNMDPKSDGGILETPPTPSGNEDDFWDWCTACNRSGKCTHCNGKGEVQKFQAGLGWVDQDCTLCHNGKCRYCDGKGRR